MARMTVNERLKEEALHLRATLAAATAKLGGAWMLTRADVAGVDVEALRMEHAQSGGLVIRMEPQDLCSCSDHAMPRAMCVSQREAGARARTLLGRIGCALIRWGYALGGMADIRREVKP